MSKEDQQLEYMRAKEKAVELRQELLCIDQRLLGMLQGLRSGLCNAGIDLFPEPMARLKTWQESGIVEAAELVKRSRDIQPILEQKEQFLKAYDGV